MAKETYLVDDVQVELGKKNAKLTREDKTVEVSALDRRKMLVAVGDSLADDFGVSNSHIWGLYNSVSLK